MINFSKKIFYVLKSLETTRWKHVLIKFSCECHRKFKMVAYSLCKTHVMTLQTFNAYLFFFFPNICKTFLLILNKLKFSLKTFMTPSNKLPHAIQLFKSNTISLSRRFVSSDMSSHIKKISLQCMNRKPINYSIFA